MYERSRQVKIVIACFALHNYLLDRVHIGGSGRSTAVDAAGILLTSPCFRRGLRTTDVMDAREEP
jgi:hypothetical protein